MFGHEMLMSTNIFPVDSHIAAYSYLDLETGIDAAEHVHISLGINNVTDKRPPVIGLVSNPLLVNGNMAAGYTTCWADICSPG